VESTNLRLIGHYDIDERPPVPRSDWFEHDSQFRGDLICSFRPRAFRMDLAAVPARRWSIYLVYLYDLSLFLPLGILGHIGISGDNGICGACNLNFKFKSRDRKMERNPLSKKATACDSLDWKDDFFLSRPTEKRLQEVMSIQRIHRKQRERIR